MKKTGRVNGMCAWRLGWRADVLREREGGAVLVSPSTPSDDEIFSDGFEAAGFSSISSLTPTSTSHVEEAWRWWRETCGAPRYVAAPMIGQSDMPFRMMCREHGVSLCYTPMYLAKAINAGCHDAELCIGMTAAAAAAAASCPVADGTPPPPHFPSHIVPSSSSSSSFSAAHSSAAGSFCSDRPLVCQIAGNSSAELIAAAKRIVHHAGMVDNSSQDICRGMVDAIDLNFCCPQNCAKVGNYGMHFLQDHPEEACKVVKDIVAALRGPAATVGDADAEAKGQGQGEDERDGNEVSHMADSSYSKLKRRRGHVVPVTVKMRALCKLPRKQQQQQQQQQLGLQERMGQNHERPDEVVDIPATVALALRLQEAGASAISIHARTRSQRDHQGAASWAVIRAVKLALSVPVIANGSVQSPTEAEQCLAYTGADAVMCGTALLRRPNMFATALTSSSFSFRATDTITSKTTAILPQPLQQRQQQEQPPQQPQPLSPQDKDGAIEAISNSRRYLAIARHLSSVCSGALSVNGSKPSKVVRDHLFAILQRYVMDVHVDLWSLLGSHGVVSFDQFDALVNAVSVRLGLEVGDSGEKEERRSTTAVQSPPVSAGAESSADTNISVTLPVKNRAPQHKPDRMVMPTTTQGNTARTTVRLYSLREIKLSLFDRTNQFK